MTSLQQQFKQLQFELSNTTTGLNQFIVGGGSAINELQFTIVNQGATAFPWKGNALDIDLSNFLTKEQIQKVIVKDLPSGWSGTVVHELGYLPRTGTYVLRLQPTSSDIVELEVNGNLTFKFEQIEVKNPPLTTGTWIDVSLHPSKDTTPYSIVFFTASAAFANQKNVTVHWPDYEENIYLAGEGETPITNTRQFEIYNNSSDPLDPNWQSSGKSPVFVVAFQPGKTENCVASEDYIQDFEISYVVPQDSSNPMWKPIEVLDTIGSVGTKFWKIEPTTNNQNILNGKESLKLNVALQSDAHYTSGQYSHAYMYVNQVDIGTTQLHQLPIYKLQVPTLSMSVPSIPDFQVIDEFDFDVDVNWAITDNPNIPNNLSSLTLVINNQTKKRLSKKDKSGVELVTLHKIVNTLELKLDLINPGQTVTKTFQVNIRGVVPNVFDLQTINPTGSNLTVYSAAPFLDLFKQTCFVVVSDNQGNDYTIPIDKIGGSANQTPGKQGVVSVWHIPNPASTGYSTKLYQMPNKCFFTVENNFGYGYVMSNAIFDIPPVPVCGIGYSRVSGGYDCIYFNNTAIKYEFSEKVFSVPNPTLTFGNSFMKVENTKTGEDDLLILIKDSVKINQWIAYSEKDSKFLTSGSSTGNAHSLPTWKDGQLIFVMNNSGNSTWGLYAHDFSNPDNYIDVADLGDFGKFNHILHIEYLSEPNYLLLLDQKGFLWIADCANDYKLLSTNKTQTIWNSSCYPSEFEQSEPSESGAFLVSDGRASATIFRQKPYNIFLTAQFY